MGSNILVTGASGKVGAAVVRHLAAQGVSARVGLRNRSGAQSLPKGMKSVAFDYEKPNLMRTAMAGVDSLFLLTPPDDRQADWATRAIDFAVEAGVKRVVRLSVAAAPMVPGIQIGRWHRTIERYLMASGLDWTVIRPVPYMQNFLGMFPRRDGTEYFMPMDLGKVSYIDTEDVGAFCAKVLTDPGTAGQTITLTGNSVLTADEAVAAINQVVGVKLRYTAADMTAWQRSMAKKEMPEWLVGVLSELFSVLSSGKVSAVAPAFEEKLGRAPISFETFAERNAEAFRAMQLPNAA